MEIKKKSIEELLLDVNLITEKWNNTFNKTGERFNVFQILGLSSNETRTHSAFLSELLNPLALHGEGTKFLELFLEEIKFEDFDSRSAKIEIEKYIGKISHDYEHGGRVDIFISDNKNNSILIENKIYAGDQTKQLYRYHKYCKGAYKTNYKIIYLNLDGSQPTINSTDGNDYKLELDNHYSIISYEKNIIQWLDKCLENVSNKPTVKEIISHYKTLIKNLTGQSNIRKMGNEIESVILKSNENFKAARAIKDLYDKTKQVIYSKFLEEIKNQGDLKIDIVWATDYKILFQLDKEYEKFYFSFSVKRKNGERLDNNEEVFKPLINIVKHIDNRFINDINNIGWKSSDKLKKFYDLSDDVIFELSNDENRSAYVEDLLNEGKQYWLLFEQGLKEL